MTLREAIDLYIAWRQAHGAKYEGGTGILYRFLDSLNGGAGCDDVTRVQVLAFLKGKGPLTRYRENKYYTLTGFYRFAISRGYATRSPLPDDEPRPPASAPPHIYSRDELHRLFDTDVIKASRLRAHQLDAETIRTLLFLLYGAGLRIGEALRLTLSDVDLPEAVLSIRGTKFFKSRLVPIGPPLTRVLKTYMVVRTSRPLAQGQDSFFIANRDGTPLVRSTLYWAFDALRRTAGIHGANGARQAPRLHDLRHSFAVHRLTAWYRQGCDVQRLLPVLSTYLGHAELEGTQVYLSMTPELLQRASSRFARYASGGSDA